MTSTTTGWPPSDLGVRRARTRRAHRRDRSHPRRGRQIVRSLRGPKVGERRQGASLDRRQRSSRTWHGRSPGSVRRSMTRQNASMGDSLGPVRPSTDRTPGRAAQDHQPHLDHGPSSETVVQVSGDLLGLEDALARRSRARGPLPRALVGPRPTRGRRMARLASGASASRTSSPAVRASGDRGRGTARSVGIPGRIRTFPMARAPRSFLSPFGPHRPAPLRPRSGRLLGDRRRSWRASDADARHHDAPIGGLLVGSDPPRRSPGHFE